MPAHLKWHGFKCYSLVQQKARRRIRENPGVTLEELHAEGIPVQLKTFTRAVIAYEKQIAKVEGRKKPQEKAPEPAPPTETQPPVEAPIVTPMELPPPTISYWKALYLKIFSFLLAPFIPAYIRAREQKLVAAEGRIAREYDKLRQIEAELAQKEEDLRSLARIERIKTDNLADEGRRRVEAMERAHRNRVAEFQEEMKRWDYIGEKFAFYKERAELVPALQGQIEMMDKKLTVSEMAISDLKKDLTAANAHASILAERVRQRGVQ